jgi:hypothetical protein
MSHSPESYGPFVNPSLVITEDDDPEEVLVSAHFNIANCVNAREVGFYETVENQTGQQWYITGDVRKKRWGYRKCFEATTAGAVTTIAHGITDIADCRVTRLYGTIQDSPFTLAVPIPQGGAVPISVTIGPTNITVNDSTAAYVGDLVYVTVEYVRDR